MITNKDISIDSENGKITLNGNKYDLGTQGEIDTAVKNVYSVMGQNGAKNLIPYPYASDSFSQRGVDFTCLSDGTINANGTNDGTGNSTFNYVSFTLSKGSYTLNGCPEQTGFKYRWGVVRVSDGTTLVSDYGSGANLTIDAETEVRCFVQVVSGKTVNNIIFKPMLRLAADTDSDYQPYAMTNKQLTDQLGTKQDTLTFDTTPTDESTNPVTSDGIKDYVDTLVSDKAISIKATTADTKNFTIPVSVWTDAGFTGSNHTAIFCGGYNGRVSAGFIGTNGIAVSVVKLGDNTVTATIADSIITLTFNDTVYTDLRLILFN